MTSAAKARGSLFEREIVKYLQDHGFPRAERMYGAGRRDDRGDITGLDAVIEAKSLKSIQLSVIMDEVAVEKANARMDLGIAVIKRRGKGAAHAYAVTTLEDMAALLLEAGYGPKAKAA